MQTDQQLRDRYDEIRAMRAAGSISSFEAQTLREQASKARQQARAENNPVPNLSVRAPLMPAPKVWIPSDPIPGPCPQHIKRTILLRKCALALADILRIPRDSEGLQVKTTVAPAEPGKTKAKPKPKKAKTFKAGGYLAPHTAIMYGYRLDREDSTKIHGSKREVFEGETCARMAYARARDLTGSGWVCAVLHAAPVPDDDSDVLMARTEQALGMHETRVASDIAKRVEKPNVGKKGWHPKHQHLTDPMGRVLSPEIRQKFARVFADAGHKASKDTAGDARETLDLTAHCRALREDQSCNLQNVDIPTPEVKGLISYTIRLNGWVNMGSETNIMVREEKPLTDEKDANGDPIKGSGARLMAERLVMTISTGPNDCVTPLRVTYTCPHSEDVVTVTRSEVLAKLGEDDEPEEVTAFEGETLAFDDFLSLDLEDRIQASRGELAPPRQRYATHHVQVTSVNGPWQKCKDSFKGGTWDRRARSQGL